MTGDGRPQRVWRVRWRRPTFSPSTATRTRLFGRQHDAEAFVERRLAEDCAVEVTSAARGLWRSEDAGGR